MESAKNILLNLKPEDYITFMKEIHVEYVKKYPGEEFTNKITNFWKRKASESRRQVGESTLTKAVASSSNRNITETRVIHGSRGAESNLSSSLQPWQQSAWKSGFIFRGDKIPENGELFIDVEKVTMKKEVGAKTHKQVAATVALVNSDGKLILWAFILRDHKRVCQYAPKMTNLCQEKLAIGVPLAMVQDCLQRCLKGNTLIGLGLDGDLQSLEFNHTPSFDLRGVFKDNQGQGFSLGLIAKSILDNRSGFQKAQHYAIDDARMTLAAYKKWQQLINVPGALSNANSKMETARSGFNKSKSSWISERCLCAK